MVKEFQRKFSLFRQNTERYGRIYNCLSSFKFVSNST